MEYGTIRISWLYPAMEESIEHEEHYGLISYDPGDPLSSIFVDGNKDDWEEVSSVNMIYSDFLTFSVTHDNGYLYILLYHPQEDFFAGISKRDC